MFHVGGFMAAMVNGREPAVTGEVEVFLPETSKVPAAAGSRRATAHVAIPPAEAFPPGARVFGTTSSSASISAAASATEGVPTAAPTAPEGCGTRTAASAPAGWVRTGTPSRAAAPTIPGSSPLASTVATSSTSAASSPAPLNTASIRANTTSPGAPRRAPTPTTRLRAPDSGPVPTDAPVIGGVLPFRSKRLGGAREEAGPLRIRKRAAGEVRWTPPVRTP